MFRVVVTILLVVAWHFPTTFLVPEEAPNARGWLIWPFGRASSPAWHGLEGAIAPSTPMALASPTVAMGSAGLASLAFMVAIGGLWGLLIPVEWCRPAAILGAVSSLALFLIYLGPLSALPLAVDGIVLWGILIAGWTQESLAGS